MLQIQIPTSHHGAVYRYGFFCKWMIDVTVQELFRGLYEYTLRIFIPFTYTSV